MTEKEKRAAVSEHPPRITKFHQEAGTLEYISLLEHQAKLEAAEAELKTLQKVYDMNRKFVEDAKEREADLKAKLARYTMVVAKALQRTTCYGDKVSFELRDLFEKEFDEFTEREELELLEMVDSLADCGKEHLAAIRAAEPAEGESDAERT